MKKLDYKTLSAEENVASLEVVSIALDAIDNGAWSMEQPERDANGVRGCVIEAVWHERNLHPEANVSQLCSHLLFDFNLMANLRVKLARAFVAEQSI